MVRLHINAGATGAGGERSNLLEMASASAGGAMGADSLAFEAQYLEQHNEMPLGLLKRYIAYCRRYRCSELLSCDSFTRAGRAVPDCRWRCARS